MWGTSEPLARSQGAVHLAIYRHVLSHAHLGRREGYIIQLGGGLSSGVWLRIACSYMLGMSIHRQGSECCIQSHVLHAGL